MWGSRHWRGEGQAKSAVARSAPTGVLAIGRGSGRRGSALTRADDDGFDRGGKYELWRQLGDCSTPPCHPVSAPCERCWVRGEGRRAARHAWQVAETSSRRLAVAALAAEIGARVICDAFEQEWMIARASWQGSLSAGNAVNSARISDDGIFYSCKRGFLLVVRLIGSLSVSLGSQGEISS